MGDPAPHAAACCPSYALDALTPHELRAVDAFCRRAEDDEHAEPAPGDEAAAWGKVEALLAERAREWLRASPVPRAASAP